MRWQDGGLEDLDGGDQTLCLCEHELGVLRSGAMGSGVLHDLSLGAEGVSFLSAGRQLCCVLALLAAKRAPSGARWGDE